MKIFENVDFIGNYVRMSNAAVQAYRIMRIGDIYNESGVYR